MRLCLFVGVDAENKDVLFSQGFLANEQTSSFVFATNHYLEVVGGHPQVTLSLLLKAEIGNVLSV